MLCVAVGSVGGATVLVVWWVSVWIWGLDDLLFGLFFGSLNPVEEFVKQLKRCLANRLFLVGGGGAGDSLVFLREETTA
ncbi:MAG: hypothetical protein QXV37_01205 [Candidatus Jordarchaeaceae archaeon]